MDLFLLENAAEQTAEKAAMDPLVVMIVGMAVVFLGLVVLIAVVKLVGLVCRALFGGKDGGAKPVKLPEERKPAAVRRSELTEAQRGELIAAISCAIAENMGKPVSGIRIRSIRKVG